ncbi:MAG: N-acetyltransferase family protein [Pyrinomonadaceae bacterium]
MALIRQGVKHDLESICAFDHIAQTDCGERRCFIERSIDEGNCFVVVGDNCAVAYGVLEYSFYEQGFMAMRYVAEQHRRNNYGTMLMRHMEAICRTHKVFTATNLSNLAMQSLLAKLGYRLSGVIHGLEENDPELVYLKSRGKAPPNNDAMHPDRE